MRIRVVVSAVTAVVLSMISLTGVAAAGGPSYVALGDSYAAGVGSGGDPLGCGRTEHAYPALFAQRHGLSDVDFVACGNATTASVRSGQLDTLSEHTDLVTITIGGNDVGFARTMTACTLSGGFLCDLAIASSRALTVSSLPFALDATFDAIRDRAPHARVVVLGYPRLFAAAPDGSCYRVQRGDQADLNAAADLLDTVIATTARLHGFSFSDVRGEFADHGLCDDGDAYLNPPNPNAYTTSYHPTADGQRGYLAALDGALS
jgi:lysophospholipase L1-like esterase